MRVAMEHVIFTEQQGQDGNLGIITLNRPDALNALTQTMINSISQQLNSWAKQTSIKAVLIQGHGERAFCAGGDIRAVYEKQVNKQFFAEEYRLNNTIAQYPKPFIAICHGITMGGGVGLSTHATFRIATEDYCFAMPETGIGFFPDVGASYFLNRCPGFTGIYLGLTGARLNAEQALNLNLIDFVIPAATKQSIVEKLAATPLTEPVRPFVKALLQPFIKSPALAELVLSRQTIDACFSKNTITQIIAALKKQTTSACDAVLKQIALKSPTSLKVTLALLQQNRTKNLQECLGIEYRLARHFLTQHDFYEGIRAAVIDKDQQPHWLPAKLAKVTKKQVATYFAAEIPELFL